MGRALPRRSRPEGPPTGSIQAPSRPQAADLNIPERPTNHLERSIGTVVHLVKVPEQGHLVHETVQKVATEVVADEEHQSVDRSDLPGEIDESLVIALYSK